MLDRRTHRGCIWRSNTRTLSRPHRLQAGAHVDPYYDLKFLHRRTSMAASLGRHTSPRLVGPERAGREPRWETLLAIYNAGGPGVSKAICISTKLDAIIRGRREARRRSKMSAGFLLSADIRLFAARRKKRSRVAQHSRLRSHHHEGPRPFSDEREAAEFLKHLAAGAGEIGGIIHLIRDQ